jgi:hypothetical protein
LLQRGTISAAALLLAFTLGACERGTSSGESPALPVSPTDYPDLARVPPRPNLSYTIEQRRAIKEGLVADRENARHRAAELAYATGQSKEPPPPRPAPAAEEADAGAPAAAAPAAPAEVPGDQAIARAYVQENLNAAADNGRLRKFMRRLDRKIPDPFGPASITEAAGLAAPAAQPTAPAAGTPGPGAQREGNAQAERRLGGHLGGILGLDGDGATPPSPVRAAAGPVVARVPFADGSRSLAAGAEAGLAQAVEIARARKARLKVVPPATPPALGLDRGREVAQALLRAGAAAGEVELATGKGAGDEVLVYLAMPRAG